MPLIHKYSDTHLDTWKKYFPKDHNPFCPDPASLLGDQTEPVLVLNAGDQGNQPSWTTYAERLLTEAYQAAGYTNFLILSIPGNHDHWGSQGDIAVDHLASRVWVPDWCGFSVAGTTLWTNFWGRQQGHMDRARGNIMDFYRNPTASPELYADLYEADRAWLLEKKPNIVFTHFPPCLESIHPEYDGDPLNPYFVNDDEPLVRELAPKLWFHGHTHNRFRYTIGETQILAHPTAYPGERQMDPVFRPLAFRL